MLKLNKYCLFAIACLGCSANSTEKNNETEPTAVPVVPISMLDTAIANEFIADIQAVTNVEVRSRVDGFLDNIYVDEGSEVSKGQLLFSINADELQSESAKAEAALSNAIADAKTVSLERDRTKVLVDKNIVSDSELEMAIAQHHAAEARIAEARSELQNAQKRLSYTQIRAPFSGHIDRIPLKAGSLLTEGSLLTSISDLNEVYTYFDISEQEYLEIANDSAFTEKSFRQPVKLTLANGQEYTHEGMAEFAENAFESHTGTISLRARFPNPNGLLKHGASGRISLIASRGQFPIVHQKSVFEIQDRTYVYLLSDSNTINMTPFEAGGRIGHYYLIKSGLTPDDTVVFEGTQSLRDGMTITPEPVDLDETVNEID